MRIGIDYQTAAGGGGNARYTRELVKHLETQKAEIFLYDFLHEIRRYWESSDDQYTHNRFMYLTPPYAPKNIRGFNEVMTRVVGNLDRLDIFHFTNPLSITPGSYKSVVTVHDMSTYQNGGFAKTASHSLLTQKLEFILHKADAIIAASDYTRRDLIEHFGAEEDKITVIYEAAGKDFYPDVDVSVKEQLGQFILYTGQLQPRKNVVALIKAFALVHRQYSDLVLVLVGTIRDSVYNVEIQKAILESNLKDAVVFAGRVDDKKLRRLYSSCECFVYPSLYEGFGLPPLEAMQCGAPVITSGTSSLPEVVGTAGILIDPLDIESISGALIHVLSDSVQSLHMRAASRAQAAQFTWNKTAKETLEVYRRTLQE